MDDKQKWLPTDEEIAAKLPNRPLYESYGEEFDPADLYEPIRALIRTAVEQALAEQEARHRREVIEALIYELDNATRAVCQGCAEGIDYWPADGSHRRQISDDGDCEGGPCNCHELSDRLHGLRAELAALDKEADRE